MKGRDISMKLLDQYIESHIALLKRLNPDVSDEMIREFVTREINRYYRDREILINNNYVNRKFRISLQQVTEALEQKQYIMAHSGVLFKQHHKSSNPAAKFLETLAVERKTNKKLMYSARTAKEYEFYNQKQKRFKRSMNSYYGVLGLQSSVFYNLYSAASVTANGRSIILFTVAIFEMLLANNLYLETFEDLWEYCRTLFRKRTDPDWSCIDYYPSVTDLIRYLSVSCPKLDPNQIKRLVNSFSKEERALVYYANNLYEFCRQPRIRELICKIYQTDVEYKVSTDIPHELETYVSELMCYIKQFVMHIFVPYNYKERVQSNTRGAVVMYDTDSTMLNLLPWLEFIPELTGTTEMDDNTRYRMISVITYVLDEVVKDAYVLYTDRCNIDPEYGSLINMKNEFLFKRIMLCRVKRIYACLVLLKEGHEVKPLEGSDIDNDPTIEIKGMKIAKTTVNANIRQFAKLLVKDEILLADQIDLTRILNRIEEFIATIYEQFRAGNVQFLRPCRIQVPEVYKNPYSIEGIRATALWNYCYPKRPIKLPESVYILPVNIYTEEDIEPLAETEPDIYEVFMNKVFRDELLANSRLGVFAIPRFEEKIPEWLIPYIRLDKIRDDIIANMAQFLEALGLKLIRIRSNEQSISNIIEF